jgi:hypothetical protein
MHRSLVLGDIIDTTYEEELELIEEDLMSDLGPVVPSIDLDPAQAGEEDDEDNKDSQQSDGGNGNGRNGRNGQRSRANA